MLMKTGDTVRDPDGRTYQVGPILGRGLWGRSFTARCDHWPDLEFVLKVPLSLTDLGGDSQLASACREVSSELGRLHSELGQSSSGAPSLGLQPLHTRFRTAGDVPVLVFPRVTTTWEERLVLGASLEETLDCVVRLTRLLRGLEDRLPCHGNLKPSNVLLDARGQMTLTDVMVPALLANLPGLLQHHPSSRAYLAPELRERGGATAGPGTDSYAMGMAVYRSAMGEPGTDGSPHSLPLDGLEKAHLVAMKDRIHNRLQDEHANPRFHTRLADRASALLNRTLSKHTSPSPPYRFHRLSEFHTRTSEVLALVHPSVTHVGRLLLDRSPGRPAFQTDEPVKLSCSVACSAGVGSHEEIACGLAVFDEESGERVRKVPCAYTVDRHPSGRFRFAFRIEGLAPGAYSLRIAFTIRESGQEPVTAESPFQVQAAPGYVPPRQEVLSAAIPLHRNESPTQVTEPGVAVESPRPPVQLTAQRAAVGGGSHEVSAPPRRTAPVVSQPPATTLPPNTAPSHGVAPRAQSAIATLPPQARLPSAPPRVAVSAPPAMSPQAAVTAPSPQLSAASLSQPDHRRHPDSRGPALLPPQRHTSNAAVAQVAVANPGPQVHLAPTERLPGPSASVGSPGAFPAEPRLPTTLDEVATAPHSAPSYEGIGRWTELPLPRVSGEDLPVPRRRSDRSVQRDESDDFDDDLALENPLASAVADLFDLVRGDAFVLFIGGAAVLIILLVVALILLS